MNFKKFEDQHRFSHKKIQKTNPSFLLPDAHTPTMWQKYSLLSHPVGERMQ